MVELSIHNYFSQNMKINIALSVLTNMKIFQVGILSVAFMSINQYENS